MGEGFYYPTSPGEWAKIKREHKKEVDDLRALLVDLMGYAQCLEALAYAPSETQDHEAIAAAKRYLEKA